MKHVLHFVLNLTFISFLLFIFVPANAVQSATFTVNSRFDINDLSPGNGLCVAFLSISPPYAIPFCTLRAAIEEANSLPGQDTILLPGGIYVLDLEGTGENNAAAGDLDITDSLVLVGAGTEDTFIDGGGFDRVLDILPGSGEVSVIGISIVNGFLPLLGQGGRHGGGGIRNSGSLFVINSVITNNNVQGLNDEDTGGGLFNEGSCSTINSTIKNNNAIQGGGIANTNGAVLHVSASTVNSNIAQRGGGLINLGTLMATNATFSDNSADSGNSSVGGAIQNGGECTLTHCTIAGNFAAIAGGGISNEGNVSMVNTIVYGNAGGDCNLSRSIDSKGYNLVGDYSCSLSEKLKDIEGQDPFLGALQDNGGMTLTHALGKKSPAIDAAIFLKNVGVDQRGVERPQGDTSDIGAYEKESLSVPPFISPLLLD